MKCIVPFVTELLALAWFNTCPTTCGGVPISSSFVAIVRRSRAFGICYTDHRAGAFECPGRGVRRNRFDAVGSREEPLAAAGQARASVISRTASGDSGTRWGSPFFVRVPGIRHVGSAPSNSSSTSDIPVTSPMRWPVTRASCRAIAVPRRIGSSPSRRRHDSRCIGALSRACQNERISAVESSRSRGLSRLIGGDMPMVGSTRSSPRPTVQRKMARTSSNTRFGRIVI